MEIKKIAVFSFAELSESSKSRAQANFLEFDEYPYFSDALASIKAFVKHFHGEIINYSLGGEVYRSYVKTTLDPSFFRGVKLKDINRDYMPTGYCLDCTLWTTMHDEWQKTGDAFYAFQQAIESALCDIAGDVEYHYSDEYVEEMMEINDYKFTEDGEAVHFGFLEEQAA
jgi:hypothetical protein